jgi:hypothetical protein
VWVLVLFCHPNSFWVWIRVLISGAIWAVWNPHWLPNPHLTLPVVIPLWIK